MGCRSLLWDYQPTAAFSATWEPKPPLVLCSVFLCTFVNQSIPVLDSIFKHLSNNYGNRCRCDSCSPDIDPIVSTASPRSLVPPPQPTPYTAMLYPSPYPASRCNVPAAAAFLSVSCLLVCAGRSQTVHQLKSNFTCFISPMSNSANLLVVLVSALLQLAFVVLFPLFLPLVSKLTYMQTNVYSIYVYFVALGLVYAGKFNQIFLQMTGGNGMRGNFSSTVR